ncbi:MAG: FtsX-like permease family protein [Candidatus Kerfeldbacteria bacterium]|nr:FtsX-like permease family protein [Candidatus Kerfeldbacteria bacterium]
MFLTTAQRVATLAGQNFWRNIWLSVATVTIMTLSLFSISLLGMLNSLSQEALSRLEEKIDISVYLKPTLKDTEVQAIKSDVASSVAGVKSVTLVTAAEALVRFKAKHEANATISESLLELEKNPLGATLVIKAVSEEGYRTILEELESSKFTPIIQEARFEDYRLIIDSITSLTSKLKRLGLMVSALFLIISLLVVFNTIRINIYTHREEIGIMRLVGARAWFIRAPFWAESALYAALSTLLAAAVFFPLLGAVQPYIDSFFNGWRFDLVEYFTARSFWFFGGQFLGAALLSILASTIAMRKYLRI